MASNYCLHSRYFSVIRSIVTLLLILPGIVSLAQHSKEIHPFVDDHKVFKYKGKNLGFIRHDFNKAWQFTIDQFYAKNLTVKQISDSLLADCKDSTALKILHSWFRLSVDSVSIEHVGHTHHLTIGVKNTYNEDESDVYATIYFQIVLYSNIKIKKKAVASIKYLGIIVHDN